MRKDNYCVSVSYAPKKKKTGKRMIRTICMVMCSGMLATVTGIYDGTAYRVQAAQDNGVADTTETTQYSAQGVTAVSPARVRSHGAVQYEYAVIHAEDLWEIDAHISAQKNAAVETLVRLGTRFRQQSGEYMYDRNPDAGPEEIDTGGLSWEIITCAAKESQSVPARLAVLHPEAALGIEGVEERTDFYAAAVEDNLSAGKAAWVDGRLLLGNGADNDRAYRQGHKDGKEGHVPEQFRPIYGINESGIEIRHVHIGSAEEREGTSGCYHNYCVTSSEVDRCIRALEYMQAVWIPNGNEPGGGSWHGGFYTCSSHGGMYESPGTCSFEEVISKTEWRHDLACGCGNMLYARLAIREAKQPEETGQQPDVTEEADRAPDTEWGQVCLEAVLSQGEGFDKLSWLDGDRLVWTDSHGNTLGTGPRLTVFEPGIYQCSIHVGNTDIDCRTAEAVVRVSGLMASWN